VVLVGQGNRLRLHLISFSSQNRLALYIIFFTANTEYCMHRVCENTEESAEYLRPFALHLHLICNVITQFIRNLSCLPFKFIQSPEKI